MSYGGILLYSTSCITKTRIEVHNVQACCCLSMYKFHMCNSSPRVVRLTLHFIIASYQCTTICFFLILLTSEQSIYTNIQYIWRCWFSRRNFRPYIHVRVVGSSLRTRGDFYQDFSLNLFTCIQSTINRLLAM